MVTSIVKTPNGKSQKAIDVWIHITVQSIDYIKHTFKGFMQRNVSYSYLFSIQGTVQNLEYARTGLNRYMIKVHIDLNSRIHYAYIYDMNEDLIDIILAEDFRHCYSDVIT